ncbi:MAG: hypothetical protein F6K28_58480 [Microcoleus sp. SIO2G3]|nr:hypothetical protein [Microcoleus sp. SIO2G3]
MSSRNRPSTSPIALQDFCDLELELSGWYALGHHNPAAFLEAVVARDPNANFSPQEVKLGWAAFRAGGFDFVTRSLPGFQPITVIASAENKFVDS